MIIDGSASTDDVISAVGGASADVVISVVASSSMVTLRVRVLSTDPGMLGVDCGSASVIDGSTTWGVLSMRDVTGIDNTGASPISLMSGVRTAGVTR